MKKIFYYYYTKEFFIIIVIHLFQILKFSKLTYKSSFYTFLKNFFVKYLILKLPFIVQGRTIGGLKH